MKIAVVSPFRVVAPHFETELEIIQRHLDEGDSVDYLYCQGRLANCDFNPAKVPGNCENCCGRREHGIEQLHPRPTLVELDRPRPLPPRWPEFSRLAELQKYSLPGFDIGYAAASSLVSSLRDPEPDLNLHRPLLENFLLAAWQTWQTTVAWLEKNRPDRVYIFNGRFAAMRAVLRACQQQGVDCVIHERGSSPDHYQLFHNRLPHDIEYVAGRMRLHWDTAGDSATRNDLAAQWFQDRRERVERNWTSFVKNQTAGSLPENWTDSKRNVVIFPSSDDEFVSISDSWKNRLFASQLEGIQFLIRECEKNSPRIHFWLRMHPNQANANNQATRDQRSLRAANLTILPPESPVDTYAMMDAAEKTVTFGSSTGIEAVWWQRPSVLLGNCYYRDFVGPHRADSAEHVLSLVQSRLDPGPRSDAAVYGYWFQTHGERFQYFQPEGLFHGRFRGTVLYARPHRHSYWQKLKSHAHRLLKRGQEPIGRSG